MRLSGENPCIIGLDYGPTQCGLACSDPRGRSAFPLPAVATEPLESLGARIREVLTDRTINRLIVGLPVAIDGTEGPSVGQARRIGAIVGAALGCPVDYLDERYLGEACPPSPFSGRETEIAGILVLGPDHPPRVERVTHDSDEWAAAKILQSWLNRGNFL